MDGKLTFEFIGEKKFIKSMTYDEFLIFYLSNVHGD